MKKFLLYCFIFIIPLATMAVIVELRIRQVSNPYKYKYEWMQKNADNVETLVFGSSHTFYGIRPEFLGGNAFSLANVSQDNKQNLFLLKYWAKRYKNLKTIIVPISFSTWFGRGMEYSRESYRCRYYTIYMDCDLYLLSLPYYFELTNFGTAKMKIRKIIQEDDKPDYDEYGWGTYYKLSKKNMTKWENGTEAEAAVKRHTAKTWNYINRNYSTLKDIADFCKKNNIQLVLITTPCWHSYYDNLDQRQFSKMHELTDSFRKEYNLLYYDYMKDKRFVADDFYDSNHLSDIGAEKFSKLLNNDIHRKEKGAIPSK